MKAVYFFVTLFLITLNTEAQNENNLETGEKHSNAKKFLKPLTLASGNFTVHYYKCEWRVNPAKNFIHGKVTAHFVVTAATNSLVFDLSHVLKVDSILTHKTKLSFSQAANETLTIQLPKLYSDNEEDSLTIIYEGVPPGSGFGSFVVSTHNGTPVMWTLSEPYGARDWWPCRNGLDDKADSIDVYITHPSKYKVSANGVLQSVIRNAKNTTTFYKHRYPIASYLVAFAVTDFSVFTDSIQMGHKSLPIISYVYPEDSAAFHDGTFRMINAMQLYDSKFTKYPFIDERYGQTEFGFGGGMEHQTNSFVITPEENLMAHELAHQWFGDKVTCGSWVDVWLNEGFATYCANFLYTEKFNHPQYKLNVQDNLENIVSVPGGSVKVDDTTNINRIFDGRLSYNKGAFLLRMLRWTLGDDLFFKGLRSYLSDPLLKYGFARTADLQRNFEEVSGLDLSYFFNQWYAGQGYPSFTVLWSQDTNNIATITISQTTSVPSSVSFFRVPLELTFKNVSQQKTIVVQNIVNNQTVTADIGFKASKLFIDPNQYLISKNNKAIHTILAKTQSLEPVTVSPNPFTDKIDINLLQQSGKEILFRLFDGFGHPVINKTEIADGSNQTFSLNIPANLTPGNYLLIITADGKSVNRYLLKK
jgi:aminopeptidase N